MKETVKTTALFIDADNVRLTAIPQILEILTLEWTPIKMRAYRTQIGPRQKILRLQNDRFEYIYLRPTNGRADDQVRRNHSTQYGAHPNFDYAESRQQAPGKYESYVDIEPGAWTQYRITVEGTKARLYVKGASQPCLIVNDLKLGDSSGGVALWIGPGTEGYFTELKITADK